MLDPFDSAIAERKRQMLRAILKKFPGLERYNQMLWALIGSGVVIAVVSAALAVAAALLYSLVKPDGGGIPLALIEADAAGGAESKAALYDFCQPLAVHDSPYQLIRVVSDQLAVKKIAPVAKPGAEMNYFSGSADTGSYYGACRIHGSEHDTGTVNVIVRHADNNSMRLLLKENALIQRLEYPQSPAQKAYQEDAADFPPAGVLYWEISFKDSNNDHLIDDQDDVGAYLSDADGLNLERITPSSSRVLEKSYDKKRNVLIMRILRDSNNDKQLNEQDQPALIEVSVAKRKMTREVLDARTLAELMQQAVPRLQAK
jgi:hypothetical protein